MMSFRLKGAIVYEDFGRKRPRKKKGKTEREGEEGLCYGRKRRDEFEMIWK